MPEDNWRIGRESELNPNQNNASHDSTLGLCYPIISCDLKTQDQPCSAILDVQLKHNFSIIMNNCLYSTHQSLDKSQPWHQNLSESDFAAKVLENNTYLLQSWLVFEDAFG